MDLKEIYYEGFVVGPRECKTALQRRLTAVKDLLENPSLLQDKFPFPIPSFERKSASLLTFRSDKKLPFWIGAMTWVLEPEKDVAIPVLQLPTKRRIPWLSEEEIVRHEEVHARRALFNERRFEEILAYHTSSSTWRRFLGPLFQTNKESTLFLLLLLLPFFSAWFYSIPALYLTLLLLRLMQNQYIYKRAYQNLQKSFIKAEKVLECLQDDEIVLFAKGKEDAIIKTSLRWQQIFLLFKRQN